MFSIVTCWLGKGGRGAWFASDIWWVETRDVVELPKRHRTAHFNRMMFLSLLGFFVVFFVCFDYTFHDFVRKDTYEEDAMGSLLTRKDVQRRQELA